MNIDQKHVGSVEGFDIDARLVDDCDSAPTDYECYSADDIAAWRRNDWQYVGVIVTASRAGIELGDSSLWSVEYGSMPGLDDFVNPLAGDGAEFLNGYGPQLIAEAIALAQAKIAQITEVNA